jgi:hypothetical protein
MVMGEIVGMSPHELEVLRSSPAWPARLAAAHTLPREMRAEEAYHLAADRAGKLAIPILLLLVVTARLFSKEASQTLRGSCRTLTLMSCRASNT